MYMKKALFVALIVLVIGGVYLGKKLSTSNAQASNTNSQSMTANGTTSTATPSKNTYGTGAPSTTAQQPTPARKTRTS